MWDDMACMGTWIPWMQWVFEARSGRAAERPPAEADLLWTIFAEDAPGS